MFIYLSKKIAIPNGVKLTSLNWNTSAPLASALHLRRCRAILALL